jgi:aspartyl-tRNA synthetase
MARCYRDEGAKPHRQPEFTQVDFELSFTTQDEVLKLIETLIVDSWPEELKDLRPNVPFRRLTYDEVMRDYGIDKPDLRIPWKLFECTEDLRDCPIATTSENWNAVAFIARNSASRVTNSLKKEWKRLLEMKELTNQVRTLVFIYYIWFLEVRDCEFDKKESVQEI